MTCINKTPDSPKIPELSDFDNDVSAYMKAIEKLINTSIKKSLEISDKSPEISNRSPLIESEESYDEKYSFLDFDEEYVKQIEEEAKMLNITPGHVSLGTTSFRKFDEKMQPEKEKLRQKVPPSFSPSKKDALLRNMSYSSESPSPDRKYISDARYVSKPEMSYKRSPNPILQPVLNQGQLPSTAYGPRVVSPELMQQMRRSRTPSPSRKFVISGDVVLERSTRTPRTLPSSLSGISSGRQVSRSPRQQVVPQLVQTPKRSPNLIYGLPTGHSPHFRPSVNYSTPSRGVVPSSAKVPTIYKSPIRDSRPVNEVQDESSWSISNLGPVNKSISLENTSYIAYLQDESQNTPSNVSGYYNSQKYDQPWLNTENLQYLNDIEKQKLLQNIQQSSTRKTGMQSFESSRGLPKLKSLGYSPEYSLEKYGDYEIMDDSLPSHSTLLTTGKRVKHPTFGSSIRSKMSSQLSSPGYVGDNPLLALTSINTSKPADKNESIIQRFDRKAEELLSQMRERFRHGTKERIEVSRAYTRSNKTSSLTSESDEKLDFVEAVQNLAKAEAACEFEGAVKAAESAAAAVTPDMAEFAATERVKSYQTEIVNIIQNEISADKKIQVLGYVGVTKPYKPIKSKHR